MQADPSQVEAVVVELGFDVAHDTEGLLVVTLRFPNGALSKMLLESDVLGHLIKNLGLSTTDDLLGRPFSELAPILQPLSFAPGTNK